MNDEILDSLQEQVNLCSYKDNNELDDFIKLRNKIDEILDSQIDEKEEITFSSMAKEHVNVIKRRAEGKIFSSGDNLFDSICPSPQAGICVLGGYSGSMKSTYIHHLCQLRIAKHLPTILFNTELSREGVMDSISSALIKENINDVMGVDNEDEHIDFQTIQEKFEFLSDKYVEHEDFVMYPENHVSLSEMENFIISSRKKHNWEKDRLLYVFVDLLSMVDDFNKGTNRTDAIKLGMDRLNSIVLTNNVFLIGTLQLKRPETIKIKTEEDIDKFRVSASGLKDSSEWENRSRLVMTIFNRKNIVNRSVCDPIVKELTEPILDLTVAKNTYTNTLGERIYYYINNEYKSLIPYHNVDEENTEVNT